MKIHQVQHPSELLTSALCHPLIYAYKGKRFLHDMLFEICMAVDQDHMMCLLKYVCLQHILILSIICALFTIYGCSLCATRPVQCATRVESKHLRSSDYLKHTSTFYQQHHAMWLIFLLDFYKLRHIKIHHGTFCNTKKVRVNLGVFASRLILHIYTIQNESESEHGCLHNMIPSSSYN